MARDLSRAAHKILTWGNHDWCGQACSFAEDAPATATSTVLQIVVDEAVSVPAWAAAGMRSVSILGLAMVAASSMTGH